MSDDFVHLHLHTEYSLLDGLGRVPAMAKRAAELGQRALALTDHGTMHGAIEFSRACKGVGVKPLIGVEAYITQWGRPMSGQEGDLDKGRHHLLLLAENMTGYRNLLQICSDAQLKGYYYRPRVDAEYLASHSEGLICTSGCLAAELPSLLKNGREKLAVERLMWYRDVFGPERWYIEFQEHQIPELTEVNKQLWAFARKYDVPVIVTNDVHYVREEDAPAHDLLLCVQTSSLMTDPKRMRYDGNSYFLKSLDQMRQTFLPYIDMPASAFSNTVKIAEMCDVDPDDRHYHLPDIEVPEGFNYESYLRHLTEEGLRMRYGARADDPEVQARKEHELQVIHNMGFDVYYLIVWDLCMYAKNRGIWWNVRGSGAGSIVAYAIEVTNLDPLRNKLIFERFLNPGRVTMPDFDLDFPDDQREELIRYTVDKYGDHRVAQVVTFGRMKARAAVRDVGRAMNVPLDQVDVIAKLIPGIPGKPVTIQDVLTEGSEFYSAALKQRYDTEETVRTLLDAAKQLEGVARHSSIHPAAVMVADRELTYYTPLMRPPKSAITQTVTQYEYPILESIGLLKIDFLGLSTLTLMREATRLIKERSGKEYTLLNLPIDDPKTYELLTAGDVMGVFQVEGAGMRRCLMDLRPTEFDHITATISLYRPGPMEFIPDFIACLHGEKKPQYVHPIVEPILAETQGVCVSGDAVIMDARTGRRYRLDELSGISDLVVQGVDDQWCSSTGRVTHWIDSGYKEVFEVTLRNGAQIKVTADHRLLTEHDWRPLSELKPGDYVGTPPVLFGPHSRDAGIAAPTVDRVQFMDELRRTWMGTQKQLMREHGFDRQHFRKDHSHRSRIPSRVVEHVTRVLELPQTARNLNVSWQQILRIEPAGTEHVYDLTVEGLHSFVANGVIVHNCVYQEQVIQILADVAGYTPGEADLVRRGISKKSKKTLDEHREIFAHGSAKKSGLTREEADAIWDALMGFARYGFNRAHAADYAVVVAQTGYLKAHYPVEYMAALLTVERHNTEKVGVLIAECRRMGIEVLPPSVNVSEHMFTIETLPAGRTPPRQTTAFPFPVPAGAAIRMGLDAIKNLGEGPIDLLLAARANRPFASLADFCERVDLRQLNRRGLECLIKVGALDDFGERYRILAAIDQLMQTSASAHEAADVGQLTLFGEVESASDDEILSVASSVPHVSNKEILEWEKELVGVYVSSHPLQQMTVDLMNVVTHASVDITEELGKQAVVVAGLLAEIRTFNTKKGDQMAFCRLEDLQGSVDITVFPQLFRDKKDFWKQDKIIIVWGKAESRNGRVSVLAERVQDYVQGQRVVEDTTSTFYRYQNGEAQPARPVFHSNGGPAGNGAMAARYVSPVRPAAPDFGSEEDDIEYGEANPFADQAPSWMVEEAGPGASEPPPPPATPPLPDERIVRYEANQAHGQETASQEAPPRPVVEPVRAPQPPVVPQRERAQAVLPVAPPAPPRLVVTFRRSTSLDADRRRLSDLVDLLEGYKGNDRFLIVIESPGQPRYELDFPNSYTCICKELKNELSQRLGPNRWRLE